MTAGYPHTSHFEKDRDKADPPRPGGINMSDIRVGGGAAGFLFSVATVLIFLLGIPSLRWFPAWASVAGALIAIALREFHKRG
jgi:cytosine/uracil/thiamine/allantoin permease